jgi:TetR/AcrR family transcriptional regulator, fatty acid metabolism regulator protein
VPERTAATEAKRRVLLEAAVRVFAKKGYHACRVADIAREAGVAYGLVYHYFSSKEEVLETIFRDTWTEMLARVNEVERTEAAAPEKLRMIAAVVLRTWRRDPELVRVLVREITRSPQLQNEVDEIAHAFDALERVIEQGQASGELRADIDSRLAALVFYGGLEEILTGWVLGQIPDGDEEIAAAERTVTELLTTGLATPRLPAEASA